MRPVPRPQRHQRNPPSRMIWVHARSELHPLAITCFPPISAHNGRLLPQVPGSRAYPPPNRATIPRSSARPPSARFLTGHSVRRAGAVLWLASFTLPGPSFNGAWSTAPEPGSDFQRFPSGSEMYQPGHETCSSMPRKKPRAPDRPDGNRPVLWYNNFSEWRRSHGAMGGPVAPFEASSASGAPTGLPAPLWVPPDCGRFVRPAVRSWRSNIFRLGWSAT